jgi:hypothetical protein
MTSQRAFCLAIFRGAVPTASITREAINRFIAAGWWDEVCELVLVSTEALGELGKPRTPLELAKCFVADGHSINEATNLLVEIHPSASPDTVQAARVWLRQQLEGAAA